VKTDTDLRNAAKRALTLLKGVVQVRHDGDVIEHLEKAIPAWEATNARLLTALESIADMRHSEKVSDRIMLEACVSCARDAIVKAEA
jgi:hypothetical protein